MEIRLVGTPSKGHHHNKKMGKFQYNVRIRLDPDLEKLQAVQVALADILSEITLFSELFAANIPFY